MTGVQTCALRSEEHTSELQSHDNLVCRLLLEKTRRDRPSLDGRRGAGTMPRGPRGHDGAAARLTRGRARAGDERGARPVQRGVFFNDTGTTEIFALSLHGALPI